MFHPTGLIHPVNVSLPNLPAQLDGVRIVHLSDLHISRPRRRFDRVGALLAAMRVDLVVLTGDYMCNKKDESACFTVMQKLCQAARPRLGIFGVFGNHDTPELRRRLASLPVRWLHNQTHRVDGLPLRIMGFEADIYTRPDSVAAMLDEPSDNARKATLTLLLCHYPNYLLVAGDLGVDVMFAGHTHGGQCRLPGKIALVNSTDLPLRLTSGLLRHGNTLAAVSRGLGESRLPLRLWCRPHMPVYTLRRGPLPGQTTRHIENVEPW